MTEKEKMEQGLLYDANFDRELLKQRDRTKDLCFQYNHLLPSDTPAQTEKMKQILGCTKGSFRILAPFWCDYGENITIGENFFANHNTVILDGAKVTFGDHVCVGPHCGFYTAGHPFDPQQREAGLEYAKPITIGHHVWIGAGVHVLPGVHIGNNTVIAAGSVVTHDIEDNCLAAGNPCKKIRSLNE